MFYQMKCESQNIFVICDYDWLTFYYQNRQLLYLLFDLKIPYLPISYMNDWNLTVYSDPYLIATNLTIIYMTVTNLTKTYMTVTYLADRHFPCCYLLIIT